MYCQPVPSTWRLAGLLVVGIVALSAVALLGSAAKAQSLGTPPTAVGERTLRTPQLKAPGQP